MKKLRNWNSILHELLQWSQDTKTLKASALSILHWQIKSTALNFMFMPLTSCSCLQFRETTHPWHHMYISAGRHLYVYFPEEKSELFSKESLTWKKLKGTASKQLKSGRINHKFTGLLCPSIRLNTCKHPTFQKQVVLLHNKVPIYLHHDPRQQADFIPSSLKFL